MPTTLAARPKPPAVLCRAFRSGDGAQVCAVALHDGDFAVTVCGELLGERYLTEDEARFAVFRFTRRGPAPT